MILPKPLLKMIPKTYFDPDEPGVLRILTDQEWRSIGITQSLGWEHYEVHGEWSALILASGQSSAWHDGHSLAMPQRKEAVTMLGASV